MMTREQQAVKESLSPEQQAWLDNPDFIRILGLKLGLMWQQRQIETDAKFHEHWDKLSWYEKYLKPVR